MLMTLLSLNACVCVCVCHQASDLDGEIDLSTCYNVTEYQAQRNYGFQIHVRLSNHRALYFYEPFVLWTLYFI